MQQRRHSTSLLLINVPGLQSTLKVHSYLRLNGIKSCHLHLQQTVFPIVLGHPGVVNATGDVTERSPILDKAVAVIINPKTPWRYALCTKRDNTQYNLFLH